jgi:hypothetical protein
MNLLEQFSNIRFYLIGPFPKGEIGGLVLNIILALLAIGISFGFGAILGYSGFIFFSLIWSAAI